MSVIVFCPFVLQRRYQPPCNFTERRKVSAQKLSKYVKISKHQRSKEEYCQNSDKVILNNFDDKFNFDILKYIKDYQ